jgi:hypothetical protein
MAIPGLQRTTLILSVHPHGSTKRPAGAHTMRVNVEGRGALRPGYRLLTNTV